MNEGSQRWRRIKALEAENLEKAETMLQEEKQRHMRWEENNAELQKKLEEIQTMQLRPLELLDLQESQSSGPGAPPGGLKDTKRQQPPSKKRQGKKTRKAELNPAAPAFLVLLFFKPQMFCDKRT